VIGCFALDQHEAGALLVASFLQNAGTDVIYLGRFNMPQQLARIAIQEDADVIGMSCHSWEYLDYSRELLDAVAAQGADIPIVLGGSVITANDQASLLAGGIAAVLGAGASKQSVVETVWLVARARRSRLLSRQ
jgi:methylmalonyl-CoA mutase C-terminal domain/subunit